jgi:hypothetical protein
MITRAIAAEMDADLGFEPSATSAFKAVADAVPAYEGLRYPALKDESDPVQAKFEIVSRDISTAIDSLRRAADSIQPADKITETPKVGHKLHRLTTMTSKTPQFHLLANGNPKPDNLLVSPLVQIEPSGRKKEMAAAVGVGDRE